MKVKHIDLCALNYKIREIKHIDKPPEISFNYKKSITDFLCE